MDIQIEKTRTFTLKDGTKVSVDDLSEEMQDHVKIFDEIRRDIVVKSYELDVYKMALSHKRGQLEYMLKEELGDKYVGDRKDV